MAKRKKKANYSARAGVSGRTGLPYGGASVSKTFKKGGRRHTVRVSGGISGRTARPYGSISVRSSSGRKRSRRKR